MISYTDVDGIGLFYLSELTSITKAIEICNSLLLSIKSFKLVQKHFNVLLYGPELILCNFFECTVLRVCLFVQLFKFKSKFT